MPDIPNRDELEAEIARRFSKLSAKQRKELMRLLGDPPNFSNIPPSFWEQMKNELTGIFIPVLSMIYLDSAERLVAELPIGVDWGIMNEAASRWARQYSFELVGGITDKSRRATQEAIAGFFEQGMTRADLEATLIRIYDSPTRAELIGVTEVTRAASEGDQEIARQLAKDGFSLIPVWMTSEDERVCEICAPLNEKVIENNSYPPAHPRCRCRHRYDLPKVRRG